MESDCEGVSGAFTGARWLKLGSAGRQSELDLPTAPLSFFHTFTQRFNNFLTFSSHAFRSSLTSF